jgi:hypothetical protein
LIFVRYKKSQATYQINFDDYCKGEEENKW